MCSSWLVGKLTGIVEGATVEPDTGAVTPDVGRKTRQTDTPQEALLFLDNVLRGLPTTSYCPVGRSFYSPSLGRRQPCALVDILLRLCQSSTTFIEALPVINFVTQLLNFGCLLPPLIEKSLRGIKVEVTHCGNMRRKYHISGLTSQATSELTFPVDEKGTRKSVVEYFFERYSVVCKIVKGRQNSKRLNERQITALLNDTCPCHVVSTVHQNADHEDPYAEEFGIKISEELDQIEARILPPPRLKYHDNGKEKDCLPQVGQWNMKNKEMLNGGSVYKWLCINFSNNVGDPDVDCFCYELAKMCWISGLVLPDRRPDKVEEDLRTGYRDAKLNSRGRNLELLLIVILPDNNGSLYGDLKRICETDLGLVSQCCSTKHVVKMSKHDDHTITFGADVTHPHPRKDSSSSIAAVVASQSWPLNTKYAGLVCAQAYRQEIIHDLFKEWQDPIKESKLEE
ncbi:hypothetical protein TSUD_231060 [Trifolium subterraneum]|nr:hypothetical protein TSUD_231060 [Trifolium subterraneum]